MDFVFPPLRKSRKLEVKWQRGKDVGDFLICDLILAQRQLQIETSINIHE